jgi:hypothetical protein
LKEKRNAASTNAGKAMNLAIRLSFFGVNS